MWILPKQLHTLAYVPDMAALSLDSNESSQLCAQSLYVRSRLLHVRTWCQKWKRDSWIQHLSGRILSPSHGQSFVTAWTSSLAATHANPSAQPESASEPTTHDIFGPSSQAEFDFFGPECVSLKTSKATSRWDSPASSAIWKNWVIKSRGEYSARLKLERLTSESGSSSWPAATTRDWKDTGDMSQSMVRKDGKQRMDTLGRVVQASPSTTGSRPESWLTPRANEPTADSNFVARNADRGEHCHSSLTTQAKSWATPRAAIASGAHRGKPDTLHSQMKAWATLRCSMAQDKQEDSGKRRLGEQAQHNTNGKLNPRWVCALMNLPVFWVKP
jgi:hypothetical protein